MAKYDVDGFITVVQATPENGPYGVLTKDGAIRVTFIQSAQPNGVIYAPDGSLYATLNTFDSEDSYIEDSLSVIQTPSGGYGLNSGKRPDTVIPGLMAAAGGSILLTGRNAFFQRGFMLVNLPTSFALNGQNTNFNRTFRFDAALGTFTSTGEAATFLRSGGGNAFFLSGVGGAFTLQGFADLTKNISMIGAAGGFTLTGESSNRIYSIAIATGAVQFSGQNSSALTSRLLAQEVRSISLSGLDVSFSRGRTISSSIGEYFVNGQNATLTAPAVFYMATTGNDANDGSFGSPKLTIDGLMGVMNPGDTGYIRGGTYSYTTSGKNFATSWGGTSSGMKKVWAYPGETVILDGTAISDANGDSASGYVWRLTDCSYMHFKGLRFQNGAAGGLRLGGASSNNIIEECISTGNGHGSGYEGVGFVIRDTSANNQFIDCDSYFNNNTGVGDPQGGADGFASSSTGSGNSFSGCRAWNNSDDGFDFFNAATANTGVTTGAVTLTNCWAIKNGYSSTQATTIGDGQGFKLGGDRDAGAPYSNHSGGHTVINCIAAWNRSAGFDGNESDIACTLEDCTSYNNLAQQYSFYADSGDAGTVADTVVNCIAFGGSALTAFTAPHSTTNHLTNSWSLGLTITSAQFVSTNYADGVAARGTDGELPDFFFVPVQGSVFAGVGTQVGQGTTLGARDTSAVDYWTPMDLGATLKSWFNADDPATGNVATWTDRKNSNAFSNATSGQQPIKAVMSFNTLYPGITFDGTNDRLSFSSGIPSNYPANTTQGDIYAVAQSPLNDTRGDIHVYGGTSGATRRYLRKSGTDAIAISDGSTTKTSADNSFLATGNIVGGQFNTTDVELYLNGAAIGSPTTIASLNTSSTSAYIGSDNNATPTNFFNGVMRHIFVTLSLTTLERQKLEGWCAWDSGLTSVLDSGHPYKSTRPTV